MSARAYLDWAASAPLHPLAREAAERVFALGAANPSSVHGPGRAARAILEEARGRVARLVGCEASEVIFTGSGTEANAAAVLGVARSRGGRLLVGSLEHPSVHLAAQSSGASFQELDALPSGAIDPERARAAIAGGASLVAVQLANNETGAVQPVSELAAAARDAGAHFHCDAVQAAGKIPLTEISLRCSSLSLSAHKLGGLPGAGALILRKGLELPALIPGHQERGRRGGTHSLAAIAAFGAVADLAVREEAPRLARLGDRTTRLEAVIRGASPGAILQASDCERVPGIVSATFPRVDGETLLVALDLAGVAAAHGAACSTGAMEPSRVLRAMGLEPGEARSTVRFSVGPDTADEELSLLAEVLPAALEAAARPLG